MVGDETIDFLRHGTIARTESGFDVANRDTKFGADKGGGYGRVHVAIDKDKIGATLTQDRFETNHDVGGLTSARSGADFKVDIGRWHTQLLEEHLGHGRIKVLSGVYQGLSELPVRGQRAADWRSLHEIGACAYDVQNVHGSGNCDWRILSCPPRISEAKLS